jgi:predicted ATPase with chaperone activity
MEAHDFSYAEASADARAYSGDDLFIAESNPSATECVDQRAGFATASMSMPVARPEPSTLAETGIPEPILLDLLLKTMHETSLNTVSQISDFIKLPPFLIQNLLDIAGGRALVEKLGATGSRLTGNFIHGLTDKGKSAARDALERNRYVGPAPVTLDDYRAQVLDQSLRRVLVSRQQIEDALSGIVLSEAFVGMIGPAISGGRALLLYGPPGNGKTTIGTRLGRVIAGDIFVPYSIEIDGQIIRLFDPTVHVQPDAPLHFSISRPAVKRDQTDQRWVRCKRPFVVVGGELTLDMLDLSFSPFSKFYEAPMHIKALNGILLVDDFGRQLVSPTQLLNRWIVPLESRVDYLRLHTGKSFEMPFDEIVIFATNLEPTGIMDPAFLRRLPYKLEVPAPTRAGFQNLLCALAEKHGLTLSEDDVAFTLTAIENRNLPLASFQPGFILDQVISACRFEGISLLFSHDLVAQAVNNL